MGSLAQSSMTSTTKAVTCRGSCSCCPVWPWAGRQAGLFLGTDVSKPPAEVMLAQPREQGNARRPLDDGLVCIATIHSPGGADVAVSQPHTPGVKSTPAPRCTFWAAPIFVAGNRIALFLTQSLQCKHDGRRQSETNRRNERPQADIPEEDVETAFFSQTLLLPTNECTVLFMTKPGMNQWRRSVRPLHEPQAVFSTASSSTLSFLNDRLHPIQFSLGNFSFSATNQAFDMEQAAQDDVGSGFHNLGGGAEGGIHEIKT